MYRFYKRSARQAHCENAIFPCQCKQRRPNSGAKEPIARHRLAAALRRDEDDWIRFSCFPGAALSSGYLGHYVEMYEDERRISVYILQGGPSTVFAAPRLLAIKLGGERPLWSEAAVGVFLAGFLDHDKRQHGANG